MEHLKEVMDKQLREAALQYHRLAPAGKVSVNATKPMFTQRDLALAYSPGVAAACELIVENPADEKSSIESSRDNQRLGSGRLQLGRMAGCFTHKGQTICYARLHLFKEEQK